MPVKAVLADCIWDYTARQVCMIFWMTVALLKMIVNCMNTFPQRKKSAIHRYYAH